MHTAGFRTLAVVAALVCTSSAAEAQEKMDKMEMEKGSMDKMAKPRR